MLRSVGHRSLWISTALRAGASSALPASAACAADALCAEQPQKNTPEGLLRPAREREPRLHWGFASSAGGETPPQDADARPRAKAALEAVLRANGPLNSDEIWAAVNQEEGPASGTRIKSKRFMKEMLLQMKQDHLIRTLTPSAAIEAGWSSVEPAKAPAALGKKGKRSKGQKFKFVYCLKDMAEGPVADGAAVP